MKTEIISFLEAELAKAYEMHDKAKGIDAKQALVLMVKASVLEELLEELKQR